MESVKLDGITFTPLPNVTYAHDYIKLFKAIDSGRFNQRDALRSLFNKDLWALLFFGLRIEHANHPFWVQSCREVETGPKTNTIDIWARGHGKTTIITVAETIQELLINPEETHCILSYAKPPALVILGQIKQVFETSSLLKWLYPDILYENPEKEAFKWSFESGLFLKRTSISKEASIEAHGLIEGMPTSRHYDKMIYDDVVTMDLVNTPDLMRKVKYAMDMSLNLGRKGFRKKFIGTFYHHDDPLVYVVNKQDSSGKRLYQLRLKPATKDGTDSGEPVWLNKEELEELKQNPFQFKCQQLCNPTPESDRPLEFSLIRKVRHEDIPTNLIRFMTVDPAGSQKAKRTDREDSWAIAVVGFEPHQNPTISPEMFILDLYVEPMTEPEAMKKIVDMYFRAGRISCVGVEKVGISTFELHVQRALQAKGKIVSVEAETLKILQTGGVRKDIRILRQLSLPLQAGRVSLSTNIPQKYQDRLETEMNRFPHWHEDGVEAVAYGYEMVKGWNFANYRSELDESRMRRRTKPNRFGSNGWMAGRA